MCRAGGAFDNFHVVAHASAAVNTMRRLKQKTDRDLKGLRWAPLKHRDTMRTEQCNDLDALVTRVTSKRTAFVWLCREQLRDILDRQQIHVVSAMLRQRGANVMRSKVEP
jgi:transposase